MRRRTVIAAVAASAALLLAGCMHPLSLKPHQTTIDQVLASLGKPSARVSLPGGGTRLVYYWEINRQCWWVTFDSKGLFVATEDAFDEEHFALVKIGVHTKKDIIDLFGVPTRETEFSLKGTTAFSYDYCGPFGINDRMKFWVEFGKDGKVLETACVIDPPDRLAM